MEEFPTFPEFDSDNNNNNNNLEFDPHTDFAQFLEEARRHSSNNMEVTQRESEKKQQEFKQEKKQSKKKPWNKLTVFFSFFKTTDKKDKQYPCDSHSRNPRHPGHVSGPVKRTGPVAGGSKWRMGSGPLFHPKKREEMGEITLPYVSLDKHNSPNSNDKLYGPLYLVS